MTSRKTITIITSPQTGTLSLPTSFNTTMSPTEPQSVYRIEERSRTIYVAGDVDPTQWDTHSLNAIFTLAEVPEGDEDSPQDLPIRRTQSYEDTQLIITSEKGEHNDTRSPQPNVFRSRRLGVKSANAALPSSSRMSTMLPYPLPPPPPPPLPKRILFYHKHNAHYGFTNFSPHPVIYNGKKYPTSEHLFQSFKVSQNHHRSELLSNSFWFSSSSIGQVWQSISEHVLKGQVSHFQKLVVSSPRSGLTGSESISRR